MSTSSSEGPPYRPKPGRIFSAARTVVAFGLVFQVAGFGKLLIVARYFGAGPLLDAYYLGLVIPAFLIGLSMPILQIGFVPAYVEATSRQDGPGAARLRNASMTWTALALAAAAALIWAGERPLVSLLWPGIDPAIRSALLVSFPLLIWTTPVNGFIDAMALMLNAEGKFAAAASIPVVNVAVSTAVILLWPEKNLAALMCSLFAGLIAQAAVLLVALRRSGIRLLPELALGSKLVQSAIGIGLPVVVASVLGNSVPAFIQVMASHTGPGAVSALGYANRLQQSIVQTIVMSVSVVLLPHFARLLSEGRQEHLRATLNRVFAATAVFYFAVVAFVAASGESTVDLLLQRGRFTAADGRLVADIWLALTTGLLGATWGIFLSRLFQAKQLPWVITQLGVVSVAVNVSLGFALMPRFGVIGIAIANSVAYVVVMVLFHAIASRTVIRFADAATYRFVLLALAVNAAAYVTSLLWQFLLRGMPPALIIAGQALIIACSNVLVIARPPLGISARALLRT